MSERIIYIKGAANSRTQTKVLSEMLSHQNLLETSRRVGHSITSVGTAWGGFHMSHVQKAFEQSPDANLIIINAHGNLKDNRHFMAKGHDKATHIWVEDFYKALAEFSGNRPLNIFMFSCGSGNGCLEAARFLPIGSTLVNITKLDDVSSYAANPSYLDTPTSSDRPYAESLFLNLLAKGYQIGTPIYPQITISAEGDGDCEGNIWPMWDSVRLGCSREDMFSPTFEAEAVHFLKDYFLPEDIRTALKTSEFYLNKTVEFSRGCSSSDTPVIIHAQLDEDNFLHEARKHGLFNVMCAVGYCASRPNIRAFTAGVTDTSVRPAIV